MDACIDAFCCGQAGQAVLSMALTESSICPLACICWCGDMVSSPVFQAAATDWSFDNHELTNATGGLLLSTVGFFLVKVRHRLHPAAPLCGF